MRKGSFYSVGVIAGLWASCFFLCLTKEAAAAKFPMPNIQDQFKKQNVKNNPSPVTMQADQVSFSTVDNKAYAKGNVVVDNKDQHLFCDQLEIDRTVQEAIAEGNVYLDTPQENVIAQGLTYNFHNGTGEFRKARMYIDPYQVKGRTIDKVSQNHIALDEGYMTTCDLDEPHFRLGGHRIDIYQHDKAIIHGMKVYLGKVPVMYYPYYVHDLKRRWLFTFVPGDKKDFGLFLLTTTRFRVGSHVKVAVHADVRERNGFGEGADIKYDTHRFGRGLVSGYFTDENHIASHHLWNLYNSQGVKKGPTTHQARYRFIWRHRWQVDPYTNVVLQYYKIHDKDIIKQGFLKTYFPQDFQQSAQTSNLHTYFLLTHNMPYGTLTFNVDTSRENRRIRDVERIPEVQYILNNQQIGKSGFYVKSTNLFSNLSHQDSPKTFNQKVLRFDSNNDITRPIKIGFIEFTPHLGGDETYFSRTALPLQSRKDIIRGMFRTGLDMSTRFYKVWDYHTNFAGLNINNLRHIITPTIGYLYQARPTFPSSELNQFDAIDNLSRAYTVTFGLENQLQTKRNGQIVDLMRFLVTSTYQLKVKGFSGHRGFGPYDTKLDINPTDWLTLHNDSEYDTFRGTLNFHNSDVTIHVKGWSIGLGNRYAINQGDQFTGELSYRINPKWAFRIYGTFPLEKAKPGFTTTARGYEYDLIRDMHEWEMVMTITQQQGLGSALYILFRLKAFPDLKLNLWNSYFHASRPTPTPTQDQTGADQTGATQ